MVCDRRGNVTRKISAIASNVLTTQWRYDLADRVTGMTYPSGMEVAYGRDAAGRIDEIEVSSSLLQ